jgi:hypothetical protein
MNKRELLEKISPLADDDDIVIALTFPKPEEGFTLGDEDDSPQSDSPSTDEDDDEDGVDNEDGTTTEFYPIEDIDVEDFTDENNVQKKVAFINLELNDEDDEDEDEDEDETEG